MLPKLYAIKMVLNDAFLALAFSHELQLLQIVAWRHQQPSKTKGIETTLQHHHYHHHQPAQHSLGWRTMRSS